MSSVTAEIFTQALKSSTPKSVLWHVVHYGNIQREKDEIIRQRQRLNHHWQVYRTAMALMLSLKVDEIEKHLEEIATAGANDNYGALESNLRLAYGENITTCVEGTRKDVLDTIRAWAVNSETTEQIFWLNDAAGTGKSTIAATLSRDWQLSQQLAGRFFFSTNSEITRATDMVCLAIAKDMAVHQHGIRNQVEQAIREISLDHFSRFEVQFQLLVVKPLQSLSTSRPVFLVIDALDNCASKEQREKLLNAIFRLLPSVKHLRVFLTSRPLQDIWDILQPSTIVCGKDVRLFDIHAPAHKDVSIFVNNALEGVASISEEHRQMIISQANGLFLYASTVCNMLKTSRRRTEILKILSVSQAPQRIEAKMDRLYLSVLRQAIFDDEADELLMGVLCTIIVAFQPISINTISTFLPRNHHVGEFVQDLGGVLKDGHPDRPIKVIHSTFREFVLSDRERANGFLVELGASHATVSTACISALEPVLQYDFLDLRKDDQLLPQNSSVPHLNQLIEKQTTPAVRYASAYWAHHAAEAEMSSELWEGIHRFFTHQFICWVELMSWRGSISVCIEGLARIQSKAQELHARDPTTITSRGLSMIWHAYQFVVNNQSLLAQSAFQVYCMPLAFMPRNSPIFDGLRKIYHLKQPKVVTSVAIGWGSQKVLEGHTYYIEQLIFSPDSSRLISIGRDGFLRLWDAETGVLVAKPFRDRGRELSDIGDCSFSSDGERLAFVTGSNTLHVLDVRSGEEILPLHDRMKRQVYRNYNRTAFSPTNPYIAAVSRFAITMHNTQGGKDLHYDTSPDRYFPVDILFSPDGRRLVSVAEAKRDHQKGRAFIWDTETGKVINSYDTYQIRGWAMSPLIAFSSDSSRFATWGNEGDQIYLRDSLTGDGVTILVGQGSTTWCKRVIFCPHAPFLAAHGHKGSSITLWEQEEGRVVSVINGHEGNVLHISFSADGQRLASIATDQTVRVWAVPSGEELKSIFKGYTGDIKQPVLSPDWSKLVTVTSEGHLNLYNLRKNPVGSEVPGKPRKGKYAHIGAPLAGTLIARGDSGEQGGLQIWDVSTGEAVGPVIEGSIHSITDVTYSPDGRMIATTSADLYLRVWDAQTRTMIGQPVYVPSLPELVLPRGFFFSPNSKLLGVSSYEAVIVWRTDTMEEIWSHRDNRVYTYAFAFSPDSTQILGVDEKNVYLTNVYTGARIVGQRQNTLYKSGAFSPTQPLIAIAYDKGVELWRINHEELVLIADLSIRGGDHRGLTFSSDGVYLAHGPYCWNVSELELPPRLYDGETPPASFEGKSLCTHSFLTYKDGWIHSTFPPGPVAPVPNALREEWLDRFWYAYGSCVLLWNDYGEPFLIDATTAREVFRVKSKERRKERLK
ncbi:hypothetical protein FRC17_000621 [Serendipita sp. 399]|nr:hypothetical protein FRC17_000621 [Serendipita sp. 399]